MVTSSPPTSAAGTDKTGMDFRRILPEIRCQSCLSPGSEPTPRGGFSAPVSPGYQRPVKGRAGRLESASSEELGQTVHLGTGIASPGHALQHPHAFHGLQYLSLIHI